MTFIPEPLMSMKNIELILPSEVALGETEIVNGIQQVGFSDTVAPRDADDPFGKTELLLEIILELKQ